MDQTIAALSDYMEPGDTIIDGGNEWYENTERRLREVAQKGILYLGIAKRVSYMLLVTVFFF